MIRKRWFARIFYVALCFLSVSAESMPLGVITFICALGFLAVACILRTGFSLPKRWLLLGAFLSYGWLTFMWSLDPAESIRSATNVIVLTLVIYYVAYAIAKFVGYDWMAQTGANVVLIYGLIQLLFFYPFDGTRFSGLTANSVQLGLLLSNMSIPFLVASVRNDGRLPKKKLTLSRLKFGIMCVLVLLTQSRGAVFGLVVAVFVVSFYPFRLRLRDIGKYSLALLLMGMGAWLLSSRGYEVGSRGALVELGLRMVNWKGYGIGTSALLLAQNGFPWFASWHNGYIGVLIEGGFPWLFIALGMIMGAMKDAIRAIKHPKAYWSGYIVLGMMACYIFQQLFEFQMLRNSVIFYVVVSAVGGIAGDLSRMEVGDRPIAGVLGAQQNVAS